MVKRFDDYVTELIDYVVDEELFRIPGTEVYENLCDFCDHSQAMRNYMTAQGWAGVFGDKYPKFVMVAYSMVLFKSFSVLEKMQYGKYEKYDDILTGLWIHYISIPRRPTHTTI